MTLEETRTAPNRNVLTRAVGTEFGIAVETSTHDVLAQDVYLLCSDGVHDMLSDRAIEQVLMEVSEPAGAAAEALVQAANAARRPGQRFRHCRARPRAAARRRSVKKYATRIAIGLAVVVVLLPHVADRLRMPFIDNLESIIYDTRLRLTMPRTRRSAHRHARHRRESLLERERGGEGRWPWPRDRLALLLDKLFDHYQIAVARLRRRLRRKRQLVRARRARKPRRASELKDVAPFQARLLEDEAPARLRPAFRRKHEGPRGRARLHLSARGLAKGALPPPVLSAAQFGARRPAGGAVSRATPATSRCSRRTPHRRPLQPTAGQRRHHPARADARALRATAYYEPLSLAIVRLLSARRR